MNTRIQKFDRVLTVNTYKGETAFGTVVEIDSDDSETFFYVLVDGDTHDDAIVFMEYESGARMTRYITRIGRSYEMIRRWGVNVMHSHDSYITDQIEIAAMDNAPQNAIFKRDTGVWATTDDIAHTDIRVLMGMEK